MRVTVPAYKWLFADEEDEPVDGNDEQTQTISMNESQIVEQQQKPSLLKQSVNIHLTLNNQEWINALQFSFHDAEIQRVSYVPIGLPEQTHEEKDALFNAEEPEEQYPEDMPEEEKKKRDDEKAKKVAEENEEINTIAKRKGHKIYIHGVNFIKSDFSQLRFSIDNEHHQLVKLVYKNSRMLGAVIPHMGDEVAIGQH